MAKHIIFDDAARLALQRGIDAVANAVKITIGPRGRNVVLDKGYGAPMITNDGVSIAKEISLGDKIENMGAEIIKEVAQKTNDAAGDGTTTAVVLTQAMVREGLRKIALGANAMAVRSGIEAAAADVVAALRRLAKPIKNTEEIVQVATISAESREYGEIIAAAIDTVGKDGVVTVEESQSFGVESEVVEGMQFDKGYASPYMVTDAERMEAAYTDPFILITDKKISSVKDIIPLLEKLAQSGKKELVIIADDVDGEALPTLVVNKIRGIFNTLAIKAPGFGDRKKELLADIAALVGAKVVSEETGQKLENVDLSVLGRARKIVATKDRTTIVGGKGKKADIEARIAQVRAQLEKTESSYDKEKLTERLGKLSGGVAVIKVGAATESEMKYIKLKIEDAVNATKAAIEEGIVPGGGIALIKAAKIVDADKKMNFLSDEETLGYQILLKSLEAPLRQIAVNSGRDDGSAIVDKVKNPYDSHELKNNVPTPEAKKKKENFGFDAAKNSWEPNMIDAGIIDPVKVTRTGVERAASAAAILLTTEVAIAEEPKKETAPAPHAHGMGEMDY